MPRCIQLWYVTRQDYITSAKLTAAPAFDDQFSTFIIPSGAGFEVIFCPGARSTTILSTSRDKMLQLAQDGRVDRQATMMMNRVRSDEVRRSAASGLPGTDGTALMFAMVVMILTSAAHFW
jgi:hypothetical protein